MSQFAAGGLLGIICGICGLVLFVILAVTDYRFRQKQRREALAYRERIARGGK